MPAPHSPCSVLARVRAVRLVSLLAAPVPVSADPPAAPAQPQSAESRGSWSRDGG